MEIEVVNGNIAEFDADLIIVNLFENVDKPGGATGSADQALDNSIAKIISIFCIVF